MVETVCEAWKIPTAKDFDALSQQLADLDERVSGLEAAVSEPAGEAH